MPEVGHFRLDGTWDTTVRLQRAQLEEKRALPSRPFGPPPTRYATSAGRRVQRRVSYKLRYIADVYS